MKYLYISFLTFSLLAFSCRSDQTENNSDLGEILRSVYEQNPDVVGIMARIEAPEKSISWSGAVGLTDKNDTIQILPDQPALITSNTKTFMAAAFLRLVEQGKVSLDSPVDTLLSEGTAKLLTGDGYDLKKIKIKNLLTNTSGISDFVKTKSYEEKVINDPKYRWTRDEQIKLMIDEGEPPLEPESSFKYSDVNYLLLSEILENITGKKFYEAISEQVNFQKYGLNSTWFYTLEDTPEGLNPLIHQYMNNSESYVQDPSFDLYGAGGLASTTKDLGRFTQLFFTGELFANPGTKDLIFTEVKTNDSVESNYMLGIGKSSINGLTAFGHTGFWGSYAFYIPELNASIVVVLSNNNRSDLIPEIFAGLVKSITH
ncbi:MAG TPA: serine hydrolase [Ignavibacteria bacterium]|nr:serine hydrolase [Ignavibacteria bacterium]HMR39768.1 serine hydrolase [Ignavibacteria bacterium]